MLNYPMLKLDVRKLMRNQFRLSKPCSNRYVFKKRIFPIAEGKMHNVHVRATHFKGIA